MTCTQRLGYREEPVRVDTPLRTLGARKEEDDGHERSRTTPRYAAALCENDSTGTGGWQIGRIRSRQFNTVRSAHPAKGGAADR